MCRACEAVVERAEAAKALKEVCEGARITALRGLFLPIIDDSFVALIASIDAKGLGDA